MSRMNIRIMRANLSDTVNRTCYQGERIVLTRHGRAVAALVPVADLEALEALENRADLEAARKALAEMKAGKIKAIPWEEAEKALDRGRVRSRRGRAGRKAG